MIGEFLRHQVFGHQARSLFVKGLRWEIIRALEKEPKPIIEEIRQEAEAIEEQEKGAIEDGPSHGHVEFCAVVLGAYRVLLPVLGDQDTTTVFIKRAMMQGMNNRRMRFSLRLMLYLCRGNPDRLRDVFSWLMKQYGATFTWSSSHEASDERHAFSFEIKRCFYFSFFSRHDVAFLTPALCQIDSLWFDMIEPGRHGFRFDKANCQTQGYGAPSCAFPIIETRKND